MKIIWDDEAWEDYLYWQGQDKKTLKRINQLVQDISRNGYNGIGMPEALKGDLSGWWSRRIDEKNRLVYRIQDGQIEIANAGHITVTSKSKGTILQTLPTQPKMRARKIPCPLSVILHY